MDRRRYTFPATLRVSVSTPLPAARRAAPREPMDPVSRYCLVAPLLRRELDQLRARVGTAAERWGDRERLEAMSDRLAELLRVSFG